jgi:anti-anti-sigma factor
VLAGARDHDQLPIEAGLAGADAVAGGHRDLVGAEGRRAVPTDELLITWEGEPVRLVIVGDIDLDTREQFKQALADLLGRDGDTRLDMAGVSFMDSHSVTAVVHCANRLHDEGGRLVVHRPPDSLLRIFTTLWADAAGRWLHISGLRGEP